MHCLFPLTKHLTQASSLVFIHEYYIACDWLPDHYADEREQAIWWRWEGYQDSLLLSRPHLWTGLQRAQCVSVYVRAAVCAQLCWRVRESTVETWSESPQLPKYRMCRKRHPSHINTMSGMALALQTGKRACRLCEGSHAAGEKSWQAACDGILAPFPGAHCSHRCWAQVGETRRNLACR